MSRIASEDGVTTPAGRYAPAHLIRPIIVETMRANNLQHCHASVQRRRIRFKGIIILNTYS